MDREALLIYLKNIYNLEMLKVTLERRYNDSISNYQYRKANLEKWTADDYHIWHIPDEPEKPTIGCLFMFCAVMTFLGVFGFFASAIIFNGDEGAGIIILMMMGNFLFAIPSIVLFSEYQEERKKYKKEFKKYEESVAYNNEQKLKEPALKQQYREELEQIDNKWNHYKMKLESEYGRAIALLREAYNINIIPAQYRNISSIYYIYQWMSTSQSSLEFVLLHTHIEDGIRRIEAKLDTIIDQNSQIIIQNRRREANDRARTNQILNSLNQIECNSADSAYYNQIAANYSRTSAFFSEATFWNSLFR